MAWTEYNVSTRTNLLLGAWFVGSASLDVWAISIYRLTIIPAAIIWTLVLIMTCIGAFVMSFFAKDRVGLVVL